MKLLICTQVVSKEHPILGFFHRWLEEFAKHCEEVHVICLFEGVHDLPGNVHVYSLGKEAGENRIKYVLKFYSYIWKLRKDYDVVFVHMNQIYVILGSLLWRLLRKKIGFWYAHGRVDLSLKMAVKMSNFMLTSTKEGLRIETHKRKILGQGIDLHHFTDTQSRISNGRTQLITVGRVAQSKNIETLIDACMLLNEENKDFIFTIVGGAYTPNEKMYEEKILQKINLLELQDKIVWKGSVSQSELPKLLQVADIFIQDSTTLSLDKALLEAAACGCVVISSNPSYVSLTADIAPQYTFEANNATQLTTRIKSVMELSSSARAASMAGIINTMKRDHSIEGLILRILKAYFGHNGN